MSEHLNGDGVGAPEFLDATMPYQTMRDITWAAFAHRNAELDVIGRPVGELDMTRRFLGKLASRINQCEATDVELSELIHTTVMPASFDAHLQTIESDLLAMGNHSAEDISAGRENAAVLLEEISDQI